MIQNYYNPTKILTGSSLEILEKILSDYRDKKILALYSHGFSNRNKDIANLFENNKNIVIYNKIQYNPGVEYIFEIIKDLESMDFEYIIAIGGGSVLDTAKAISAIKNILINNRGDLRRIILEEGYNCNNNFIPIIAIPTTSGTGSEVTSWSTIWDFEEKKKYSISSINLYPKMAIIDPELTSHLPQKLTAITGLDALSHAIESYWARSTNDISRLFAIQSIETIVNTLPNLIKNLDNLELRKQMALGSLYAGLAFSNTRTTACHSISYPLTIMYNIPHGVAVSMTLGKILEINKENIVGVDELFKAFSKGNVNDIDDFIKNIFKISNINYKLGDYGVEKDDIPRIVSGSFTKGRMDNNPVDITEKQLEDILINLL